MVCFWLVLWGVLMGGQAEPESRKQVPIPAKDLARFALGQKVELPPLVRWWRWHGGSLWAPNGIDEVYRVESGWSGLALTAIETGTPAVTRQFQSIQENLQRFRFEQAVMGFGVFGWKASQVHSTWGSRLDDSGWE
ncbi:MAG: hypothetical protein D6820_03885 [Lentisphaerae bacterium]|nr:MAG: hypothetical protein D6820_03885 [Lentisphaerota bacterium]